MMLPFSFIYKGQGAVITQFPYGPLTLGNPQPLKPYVFQYVCTLKNQGGPGFSAGQEGPRLCFHAHADFYQMETLLGKRMDEAVPMICDCLVRLNNSTHKPPAPLLPINPGQIMPYSPQMIAQRNVGNRSIQFHTGGYTILPLHGYSPNAPRSRSVDMFEVSVLIDNSASLPVWFFHSCEGTGTRVSLSDLMAENTFFTTVSDLISKLI